MPVPLLCGNVIGSVGVSLGLGSDVLSSTSDIAPYVYHVVFGSGLGSILFILMIFMAGLSTGGDVLSGAQSICTVDIYKKYIKKEATEADQVKFGKRMTIVIGVVMAVVAMFFEGRSLVSIDVMTGILFAAHVRLLSLESFGKEFQPGLQLLLSLSALLAE